MVVKADNVPAMDIDPNLDDTSVCSPRESSASSNHDESNANVITEVAHVTDDNPSSTRVARQWLFDRVTGASRPDDKALKTQKRSRPPLFCCYVPPCVRCCPTLMEQNVCCEKIGACGVAKFGESRKSRRNLMIVSLVVNKIGFIFTLLACLAMSTEYNILTAFSFTNGYIRSTGDRTELEFRPVEMAIGLRAVATENIKSFTSYEHGRAVYTFDQFCDLANGKTSDISIYLSSDTCDSCNGVSSSLTWSLIFSLLSYMPSFFTGFTRLFANYDVNCQKFFAMATAIVSFCLGLETIINYKNNCFRYFFEGNVPLGADKMLAQSVNTAALVVDFDWYGGVGLLCLTLAMVLKVVELLAHVLLPTPTITRNHQEQAAYEQQQDKLQVVDIEDEESPTQGTMERGLDVSQLPLEEEQEEKS